MLPPVSLLALEEVLQFFDDSMGGGHFEGEPVAGTGSFSCGEGLLEGCQLAGEGSGQEL